MEENTEYKADDANKYGITALIAAGNNPTTPFEVFELLICKGAKVNSKDRFENNVLRRHLQFRDINLDVVRLVLN